MAHAGSTEALSQGQRGLAAKLVTAAALAILMYVLFFHHLGVRDLWSSHEGRAAQHGLRILQTGEWVRLRLLDGRDELQKPPLYYWLVAVSGKLIGEVDALAARLPAAVGAVLAVAAVGVYLGQHSRCRAAVLAMLMLATCVRFTWLGRVGRIDMPLTAAVSWTAVGFFLAARSVGWQRQAWLILAWLALSAAMLLKGPVGVVMPGLMLTAWLMLARRSGSGAQARVWLRSSLWGVPLFLALSLPWYVVMNQQTEGKFFEEFVIRHNIQRGLGGDEQLDGHVHPSWFYLAQLWVDALPWSGLVPLALAGLWRRSEWRSQPALQGLTWLAVPLVFLSVMRYKRPDYLLPAYPGLAVMLACVVDHWLAEQEQTRRRRMWFGVAATVAAVAGGWLLYVDLVLPRMEAQREFRQFAAAVRSQVPSPAQVILFRIDSHHLVFRLGPTTERLWEWENLDWWVGRPAQVWFIMPRHWAEQAAQHLQQGQLHEVLAIEHIVNDRHEQPLVLLTNRPVKSTPQWRTALVR